MLKTTLLAGAAALLISAGPPTASNDTIDAIARDYVVLALRAHALDPDMVSVARSDADALAQAKDAKGDKTAIATDAVKLVERLDALSNDGSGTDRMRQRHLRAFLVSLRSQLAPPDNADVERQVREIYGFTPRFEPLARFDPAIDRLQQAMPGAGSIGDRIGDLRKTAIVPKDRIPAVFEAALAECRRRTLQHIKLPPEHVEVQYPADPTFPGANNYVGNGKSIAAISTDYPENIDQLLILACHEVYPGHHVHYLTLDTELAGRRHWPEFEVDMNFGPLVPVAEGVAETATGIAFSPGERLAFERDRLYPLAGLRMQHPEQWVAFWQARPAVLGATSTVARDYLAGKLEPEQAKAMFMRYRLQDARAASQLLKIISVLGPYVIASDLGWQATDRIMRGKSRAEQWRLLHKIESEPMLLDDVSALARQ
jgi:hypothetical protein